MLDDAFGNFEDLLTDVTLSPVMGDYLDMVNNDKPVDGDNPERELRARADAAVLDRRVRAEARRHAARRTRTASRSRRTTRTTIEGFAHVFTGWTYPLLPGARRSARTTRRTSWATWQRSPRNHDTGAKPLLYGAVAPAGQTMDADLANAIHNIFHHPNVGPFIGRQLIQKLVTSDPSPQYVARVAAVFNNNGHGVRGDMRAVVARDPRRSRGARRRSSSTPATASCASRCST